MTRPKEGADGQQQVLDQLTIGDELVVTGRQPLAPVQSSKKRKRDRASLDGDDEEVDTVSVFLYIVFCV